MPSAFGVAAGIINPVTGRWITKSWNFDHCLPKAIATYTAIEQALGIRVYHPIPVVRFCQNEDDVKRVHRRMRNPRYQEVISDFHAAGRGGSCFNDPHGSFRIEKAAYVDLPALVHALRHAFSRIGCYQDETFAHAELQKSHKGWHYRGITAHKVLFCEGAAHSNNPWFQYLPLQPLQPAKGETLLCQSPTLQLPQMLFHHKKWFLPYPDGSFRIGATYDESDPTPTPTGQQKTELLQAAQEALKEAHTIDVLGHLAGIRPSSVDSRPILGAHPEHPGLFLFNGLGSKGATTSPAMARHLCEHLLDAAPLPPEVCLSRFP
jgi:glycine/D-amino acid oxidase-like deaminating enzyme